MRIKLTIFISLWFSFYSCTDDKTKTKSNSTSNVEGYDTFNSDSLSAAAEQKETVSKKQSRRIEFLLKVDAHAEEFDPNTTVYVVIDNESNEVAAMTGEGQIINKSSYKQYGIPTNALQACGAEYGGLGEYYYLIRNGYGELELYKGWSDEHTIGEGNHWTKVEDFK
jgi:hypothetical protein